MSKFIFYILLIICSSAVRSQNLIPNGSFENYSSLPDNYGQVDRLDDWNNVNNQYFIGFGTPDYYNTQSFGSTFWGTISPQSGYCQVGLQTYLNGSTNYREYISTQLITNLIPNVEYKLSFYITSGVGTNNMSSDNFGILLSNSAPSQTNYEPIVATPQFVLTNVVSHYDSWEYYEFIFVSDSNYSHITFGNFEIDANLSFGITGEENNGVYYFLDNVSLVTNDFTSEETFEDCQSMIHMPNGFTPNNDNINDLFEPLEFKCVSSGEITILNRWGNVVFKSENLNNGWDGYDIASSQKCVEGVYFWIIDYINENNEEITVNGFFHLIE